MIKQTHFFIMLLMVTALFSGCSSEDNEAGQQVVFNNLTTSKTIGFTDEAITLNIDGGLFDEVVVSTNKPEVTITKVSNTTYTVEASKALKAVISVQLKNAADTKTKSVTLEFFEHGVKDFKIVEGIEIDKDKTDKVIALLGEPEGKLSSTDGKSEFWYYFSKGFALWIVKSSGVVFESRVYGMNWQRTIDKKTFYGVHYPYEIGNGWKLENTQLKMDDVITKLSQPEEKHGTEVSSGYLIWYVYHKGVVFFFFSNSKDTDNYRGRRVPYINVY